MKKYLILVILLLSCTISITSCKKKEKIDAPLVPAASTITSEAETTKAITKESKPVAIHPKPSQEAYVSDKLSIQYPKLTNLANPANEVTINELIKNNALSIIKAYDLDPTKDSLNITYNILSLDRNRVTILYNGDYMMNYAAYPTTVCFTNTINLNNVKNIRLTDYIDATSLGNILVSDGAYSVLLEDNKLELEIRDYLENMELSTLEALFNNADFGGNSLFPESFSYEEKGTIIFTVPVPHALGNFVKLSYTPESK